MKKQHSYGGYEIDVLEFIGDIIVTLDTIVLRDFKV
jgi:hypothetical protein